MTFGPPQVLLFDGETALDDEESTTYFQLRGICKRTAAPRQHIRICDRKIAVMRDALRKLSAQLDEEGLQVPFSRMCSEITYSLNALTMVNGSSPFTAVLGRMPAILPADGAIMHDGVPDNISRHTHRLREVAVQAIAEGTAKERMRRALRTQTQPSGAQLEYKIGDRVDYWRTPLSRTFGKMEISWKESVFCGVRHVQHPDGSVTMDQMKFLAACKPIMLPATVGSSEKLLSEEARRHFLSLLMTIAYALLTRPDVAVFVSALQRESHQAKIIHVKRLNVLLRWLQSNPKGITYPVMKYPTVLLQISDSSYKARATDGLSVRGLVSVRVSLDDMIAGKAETPCHVLDYVSKAQRHVTRSTFSSELFAATDAVDSGLLQSIVLHELQHGVVTPSEAKGLIEGTTPCAVGLALAVDAKSVSAAVVAPNVKVPAEPSLLLHVMWLRSLLTRGRLKAMFWTDTRSMVADGLTKGAVSRDLLHAIMCGLLEMPQPYEQQVLR